MDGAIQAPVDLVPLSMISSGLQMRRAYIAPNLDIFGCPSLA
ncbi:MAG: hypothetical protein ACTSYB_17875 [Candidatus Helarchaeota archaeon]